MPAVRTGLAAIALLGAVGVVSIRVLGPLRAAGGPAADVYAMYDFRDAVYDPIAAFVDGENPYDRPSFVRKYPGVGGIGLYSPLTLLIHLPFGLLPLPTAAIVYFVASLLGTIALAPLALRLCGVRLTAARALGLGALLVASRPGQWNLFNGQVTLQAALGVYVALWYARSRPTTAGLGLALATFKPTYGLPLAGLLLARGDRRALGIGVAIAAVLTGIVGVVLAFSAGLGPLVSSVVATYQAREADPEKSPAVAPFRIDAIALVARELGRPSGIVVTLALTTGILAVAAVALRQLSRRSDREARALGVGLGVLAIVVSTYHFQYDGIALAPLLTVLLWPAADGIWRRRPWARRAGLGLLLLPFANYLASGTAAQRLSLGSRWLLRLSSLNGAALLALLGLIVAVVVGEKRPRARVSARPTAEPSGADLAVRLAGPEDTSEIFECVRACFAFEPDVARYRHLHASHPVGPSITALGRVDGRLVTGVALLLRRAHVFGWDGMLGHVVDAMTLPEWRGQGLRSRATDEIRRAARARGSLGVFSFANELSLPGNLRQERRRLVAATPVLLRPIRPLAALAAAVSTSRPASRLGIGRLPDELPECAIAGPLAVGAHHLIEAARACPGWSAPSFDAEHASLFREAEGLASIFLLRDTAHLRWRYADAPGTTYLQRDERRAGELEATIIARSVEVFGVRLVLVMDWAWRPDARPAGIAVLRDLVHLAHAAGAHAVSALAMPGTFQRRMLWQQGFVATPGPLVPKRVVFNVGPDDERGGGAWYRPESWYLTWGDGFLF